MNGGCAGNEYIEERPLRSDHQFAHRVAFKAIQRVQLRFRLTIEAAVLDANELTLQRAPSPSPTLAPSCSEPTLHSCLLSSRLRVYTLIKQVSRGKGAGNG